MRDYVRELALEPHPEGGFYRQVYKSEQIVQREDAERSALTGIYFFLPAAQHSRWHRVLSDEIWVHLDGAPLTLHVFREARWPAGAPASSRVAARASARRPGNLRSGGLQPAVTDAVVDATNRIAPVAAGAWQAAEPSADVLVACFVAPGFEFADFALMSDDLVARQRLSAAAPELLRLV
jgi:predicted cupin superfamily sugar epimerase